MTRRQWALIAVGAVVVLVGGFAIGYAISSAPPAASPSPSATPDVTCQVDVSPATIRVDPDTGISDDILFFAGSGFPASSAIQVDFGSVDAILDFTSTAAGDFTAEIPAAAGTTHPLPPDIRAGTTTLTVFGWDGPDPPDLAASAPPVAASTTPLACEVEVAMTIELTHAPSSTPDASPPTDLSAGAYAEILADGVRVRVEPSLTATVVGALFTGDVVRILAPAQVAEGLVWYRVESVVIQSGEPVRGYVAAGADGQVFLQVTTEPPPPTPTPSPSPSASPT